MLITLDTSHFEMSPLNDVAERNISVILVTLDTSHFEMSASNDFAPRNMADMSFTRDTSHFEMSPLKETAEENMRLISVAPDTSHFAIGPKATLEQSPFGSNLRHASTALSKSAFECGENTTGRERTGIAVGIDA